MTKFSGGRGLSGNEKSQLSEVKRVTPSPASLERRYHFGLPAGGVNGLIERRCARQDRIKFIQVRHEGKVQPSMLAPMRSGPDEFGVCLAMSGPGGIHLLDGLCDAKLDG
jgi:thiamine pyrophosphate-dependent acetolactate synthase large subunit-like protein